MSGDCRTCDGTGVYPADTQDCPDCSGPCTWCGGEASEDCTDPLAGCCAGCTGDVCPCRACDGSGLRAYQRTF